MAFIWLFHSVSFLSFQRGRPTAGLVNLSLRSGATATSARDLESISREAATMVTRLDLGSTLTRDISGNLCPRSESVLLVAFPRALSLPQSLCGAGLIDIRSPVPAACARAGTLTPVHLAADCRCDAPGRYQLFHVMATANLNAGKAGKMVLSRPKRCNSRFFFFQILKCFK